MKIRIPILARKEFLLQLVRMGIGNEEPENVTFPETVNWKRVEVFASKQGLSGIILDSLGRYQVLYPNSVPPKALMKPLIMEVVGKYEYHHKMLRKAIAGLGAFYEQHGIKMMVIKGYACSLDWPKPEHRPVGDIDIWLFNQYKEGDEALKREKGIKIDTSQHHHTVFQWGEFVVENHYDFINVHLHRANDALNKILKDLAKDDSYTTEVDGQKVYLPSPNLHALFLLRHSATHFTSRTFSLRILLDWGLFVKAHSHQIDWKWLEEMVERFGMLQIFHIFNAICIEDFGFDPSLFPPVQCQASIKERVLNDIILPEFTQKEPKSIFPRAVFRYRRWKANSWKHELCFNESRWGSFWRATLSHMLKPKTI